MTPPAREVNEYSQVTDLFQRLAEIPAGISAHEQLRTEIIETCLPLAHHIVRRYRGRGQSHEDLVQVASVGLVSAVNRFDLAKGKDFLSFAVPTMMGEGCASTSATEDGTFGFPAHSRKTTWH